MNNDKEWLYHLKDQICSKIVNLFIHNLVFETQHFKDHDMTLGTYRWFKCTQMKIIHKHNLFHNFYFICFRYKLKTILRYVTYTIEKRNSPSDAQ